MFFISQGQRKNIQVPHGGRKKNDLRAYDKSRSIVKWWHCYVEVFHNFLVRYERADFFFFIIIINSFDILLFLRFLCVTWKLLVRNFCVTCNFYLYEALINETSLLTALFSCIYRFFLFFTWLRKHWRFMVLRSYIRLPTDYRWRHHSTMFTVLILVNINKLCSIQSSSPF